MGLYLPFLPHLYSYSVLKSNSGDPRRPRKVLARRRTGGMSRSRPSSPFPPGFVVGYHPFPDALEGFFSHSPYPSAVRDTQGPGSPCRNRLSPSPRSASASQRNTGPGSGSAMALQAPPRWSSSFTSQDPQVSFQVAARNLLASLNRGISYFTQFDKEFKDQMDTLDYLRGASIEQIWRDRIAFADRGRWNPSSDHGESDHQTNTGYSGATTTTDDKQNRVNFDDRPTFSSLRGEIYRRCLALVDAGIPGVVLTGRNAVDEDDEVRNMGTMTPSERREAEELQDRLTQGMDVLMPHLAEMGTKWRSVGRALREMRVLRSILRDQESVWMEKGDGEEGKNGGGGG